MRPIRVIAAMALIGWMVLGSAHALVITSGNGTGNTTAPPVDPGWDNIITFGSGNAIYVGNQTLIVPIHVGAGDVNIGGEIYHLVGTPKQIQQADMYAFKIDADPGLPALTIATSTPVTNTELLVIGTGLTRATDLSYWNNTWEEVTHPPYSYSGYKTLNGSRTKRWGTNRLESKGVSGGNRYFKTKLTSPGSPSATEHEAHAVANDSGGAIFYWNVDHYELAGMIYAVAGYSGQVPQPQFNAIFGNETWALDLAFYSADLLAFINGPLLPGDWNLDGMVDAFDMVPILSHWGDTGVVNGWDGGDPTGDGVVDAFDLTDILINWGQQIPESSLAINSTGVMVPEPASYFLTLAASGLLMRRRRHGG